MRFKKLKKENRRLSESQILDWTVQLLSAVNYMHSRRVLHRDLKARLFKLRSQKNYCFQYLFLNFQGIFFSKMN